jgi:hypothetical protein
MNAVMVRDNGISAAECLAALRFFYADPACRRCACFDWALGQVAAADDAALAKQAASLRPAPAELHACLDCRPCSPLDAVLTWLVSGRHTAEL